MTNQSLPEQIAYALKRRKVAVSDMVNVINDAVEERARFEMEKRPNNPIIEMRKVAAAFTDSRTVAAFFLVLNIDPDTVFNRVRKDGSRSDLKGLQKVRKVIDYVTGKTRQFERVSLALFASTIIVALKRKKGQYLTNPEQELILSPEIVSSLPKDIQEAVRQYQHKYMSLTGDSRPEACRFRTTFANIGCYFFHREDAEGENVNAITVNLEHPLIQYLTDTWGLAIHAQ